jgi:hypothetical protein
LRKKAAISTDILERERERERERNYKKISVNYLLDYSKNFKTHFIYTKIVENKYFPTIKSNIFLCDSLNE